MSTIVLSQIFLPSRFSVVDTGKVNKLLSELYDEFDSTRKGTAWTAYHRDKRSFLNLSVADTNDLIWDYEDDLLTLDILPDDVPDVFIAVTGLGTDEDLLHTQILTERLVAEFGGLSCGARKCS